MILSMFCVADSFISHISALKLFPSKVASQDIFFHLFISTNFDKLSSTQLSATKDDDRSQILPASLTQVYRNKLIRSTTVGLTSLLTLASRSFADSERAEKFTIKVPAGWTTLPRKLPSASFSKYLSEEILLVASNFNEGVSLSVTRSNAQRLLKDFNIDWWFDNLQTITDVGDANLISRLLILQRQENFDGKNPSASTLINANLDGSAVYFEFDTPVVEGVSRRCTTKVFYKDGFLYTLWISGLESVFNNEYAAILRDIQDSFHPNI